MKTERPILFSGPMVRAVLEGRKTQTRRVVKPQDQTNSAGLTHYKGCLVFELDIEEIEKLCPYGQPGDRLWVRETTCIAPKRWATPDDTCRTDYDGDKRYVAYKADGQSEDAMRDYKLNWTPSIHVPRWASRIDLEITGVRVERLQEISDADILAEGVTDDLIEKIIGPMADRANPKDERWICGADQSRSFCEACGEKRIAKLKVEQPDGEFRLAGGYGGTEGDSIPFCEDCGEMLGNTLTDYGAAEEFAHVLENGLSMKSPEACYILQRALGAMSWSRGDAHRLDVMHKACWRLLWDSINGKRKLNKPDVSWTANPWVWVVEFKRLEGRAAGV